MAYDHYKDSFEQQKLYIAKRDRLTIWLLLTVIGFTFLLSNPETLTDCVNQYIQANYQIKSSVFAFSMLHTGVIYLMLWLVLQYYQVCLTIENHYHYIGTLESKLSKEFEQIARESSSYASNYPLLKNVANILYAWGIPISVACMAASRGISVYQLKEGNVWLDMVGLGIIFILSLLYFSDRNLNWKSWSDNHGFLNQLKGFLKIDIATPGSANQAGQDSNQDQHVS